MDKREEEERSEAEELKRRLEYRREMQVSAAGSDKYSLEGQVN